MKRLRNTIILLMIIFTCSTVSAEIKSYLTFFNNRAIYQQAGASWEELWRNSLILSIIFYVVVMALLVLALVGLNVYKKKKAAKLAEKQAELEA